jgi:hypothetical protein
MQLTEKENDRFLNIHISLIHFAGINEGLISRKMSLEDFQDADIEIKVPVRDALYGNPKYFDKFVKENPYDLQKEDLQVADGFRHFKKGQFWLLKYLKKHAIFLDGNFAYGVLALSEPFEWFFGNTLPRMIETVLLPFEGKIVYDGIMKSSNIIIGGNMTSSLNSEYSVLKAKYGLITQLPLDEKIKEVEDSDENTLIALMKSKSSIDHNWYEIEDLLERTPSLKNLYEQLWGKLNSRNKKKELRKLGIKGHYFAITNNTIITSGKSKKEVEVKVKSMVDEQKIDSIYYFKL